MAVVFSSVLDPGTGPLRSQPSLDFVAIGVAGQPLLIFPWTNSLYWSAPTNKSTGAASLGKMSASFRFLRCAHFLT